MRWMASASSASVGFAFQHAGAGDQEELRTADGHGAESELGRLAHGFYWSIPAVRGG